MSDKDSVYSDLSSNKIITGNEAWCFQYDPENKWQSLQWKQLMSTWPKEARMLKSQMKKMLITFFDIKDIAHYKFI
jgi:hypothetical protein